MSKENTRQQASRSHSTQIISAAAIATLAIASVALAQVPVVDGVRDVNNTYGAAVAVQTVQTQFGDANPNGGSELDAGYVKVVGGKLYLMATGNIESNFNKNVFFFDTRAGGQNVMRADNPGNDFGAMNKYAGMTFDAGFEADYAMWFGHDGTTAYLHFAELNTNGGGFGDDVGSIALSSSAGSATVGGQFGRPLVNFGLDNSNIAGVTGGTGAADPVAAAAVTTGTELGIELPAIGATENFKVMVGVNAGGNDFWSNQFLGGLPADTANLGNPMTVNFNNYGGDQFFNVAYAAPLSQWTVAGNGNWTENPKWSAGSPNGIDARAVLGTLGGAGAKVVTLDTNVRLASLTFDNTAGYTIAASGGNVLTIAGNGATPAVVVTSGNHSIGAPLTLGNTTNFTIAAGSTLDVTGALTATNQTIVKAGDGTLQVPNVRAAGVHVSAGTVRVATNGGDTGASEMNNLSFDGGYAAPVGTFDLRDNDLIVHAGSPENAAAQAANLSTAIAFARNAGAWDRAGLTSSAAAAATPRNKTLGVLTGAEYHVPTPGATFNGLTVADTDVLVKFTYYGDTDFNGLVDFYDYSRIDAGFNNNRTGWFNGDVDSNGIVDFDDYSLIDQAFNTQSGTLRRAMSYLDGSDRSDAGMDTPQLQLVMQHLGQFGEQYAAGFLASVPEPTSALVFGGIAAMFAGRRRRAR
ncbi:MAG: PEP-CTERM sorting domain-containing protein [Anaerolineae bacterium]|nr:PEP-CTERM sorting domain-containing protein [Phycisphaerae bacterium]